MHLYTAVLAAAVLGGTVSAAATSDDKPKETLPNPCTIRSLTTGNFFDLNHLRVKAPKPDSKETSNKPPESWHVKGYDYGANFTLNICGPVVEELDSVVGIPDTLRKNVSAYYTKGKDTYSMGFLNTDLVLRGRKLVLNYTHGSPCGASSSSKSSPSSLLDSTRHKSTIISFLCDREPLADPKAPKAAIQFIGTDEEECSYFFEVKSFEACPTSATNEQQLGPGGVFGVIMVIALLAYFAGGCVYQRTVMHQRGWKQLPNYALWASLFGFLSDIFIILTSSCMRFLPGRRGYNRISIHNDAARSRHSEDENRLIDQLDEEWDD